MTSATISIASRSVSSADGDERAPGRMMTRGALRLGRWTEKREPPLSLSAWMRPPCHSTIDLQIASPSPVPP
jgi:hypothetical protein